MISQVESFLCSDKQRMPEEGRWIQRPKRSVTTNKNKDEDNSSKNHTQRYLISNIVRMCTVVYVSAYLSGH